MNTASRIGHYLISPSGDEWTLFGHFNGDGITLDRLAGNVRVDRELDVTWLSSWSVRDAAPARFKTEADVAALLATLPAWDETRWACKWDDFGNGTLVDCKTGEVDEESPEAKAAIERIKAHLKARKDAACPVCGQPRKQGAL